MPHSDDRRLFDATHAADHDVSDEEQAGQRHSTTSVGVTIELTEERLSKEQRTVLSLKNGGQIEAGLGLAAYDQVTFLFQKNPNLFTALLSIARGNLDAGTAEEKESLRNGFFLRQDFSIVDSVHDVLLSAYQETPDGPTLVNPFQLETPDHARLLERLERAALIRILRLRDDNPGTSQGRQ
jgi:hypothetical protein